MILVDTSIWVDHFRATLPSLVDLIENEQVLVHPFVVGELALGNLSRRDEVLARLHDMPSAPVAEDDEVLAAIDAHRLFGAGIGYVDAHLLAAVRLRPGTTLWTRDKSLNAVAERLALNAAVR